MFWKMSKLSQINGAFEQTISPSTINTLHKMKVFTKDNCLVGQTTSVPLWPPSEEEHIDPK